MSHVIELTAVRRASHFHGQDSPPSSTEASSKEKAVTRVATIRVSTPTTHRERSITSKPAPRVAWANSVTISKSTHDVYDELSWIDKNAGWLENAGKVGCVAGAILRFVHGIYDIALKKPIGVLVATVVAIVSLLIAIVVGIFGCWSKTGRALASDFAKISFYNVSQIENVVGNPLKLVLRGILALVALFFAGFFLLFSCCSDWCLEAAKSCASYSLYNVLCMPTNMGRVATTILSGVPRYFLKHSCSTECYESIEGQYWKWMRIHLSKRSLPSFFKDSSLFKFVRECTGGVDFTRNIAMAPL